MNGAIDQKRYQPERYHWNQWEKAVKKRGMERTLAELGREVIRDADQHNWAPELRNLCSEPALEKLLLGAPFLGRRLCDRPQFRSPNRSFASQIQMREVSLISG